MTRILWLAEIVAKDTKQNLHPYYWYLSTANTFKCKCCKSCASTIYTDALKR